MSALNFLLALSPIILLIIEMIPFKMPAKKAAPTALLLMIVLALTYFRADGADAGAILSNYLSLNKFANGSSSAIVWKGLLEGLKIVLMVFCAFLILNTLQKTHAIDQIKVAISSITDDRRAQVIIIGLFMPIFLEGAAGAGAPAAIAAPFLVALGINPVTAIIIALMGDATPCSWGGAGLTTITGGNALVAAGLSTEALNSAMVGRLHMFGVMVMPFLMIAIAFGRKGFKNLIPYLAFSGVSSGLVMFIISNFIGPETTSLGTGLISILLSVVYLRFVGIKTPDEFKTDKGFEVSAEGSRYKVWQALLPYICMLVLLPIVRYGSEMIAAPWYGEGKTLYNVITSLGYIVWVDAVLFICAIIGAIALKVKAGDFLVTMRDTLKKVMPVCIVLSSLLIVAYIMQDTVTTAATHNGETMSIIKMIAKTIADAVGPLYPALAVLIGSIGSFVTGTGLGSNVMFAPLHIEAAASLDISAVTVFAGQNAGASLGNLICPNNVAAACATVGENGHEGYVIRRAIVAFSTILVLYMALTMLYTYVLFPGA